MQLNYLFSIFIGEGIRVKSVEGSIIKISQGEKALACNEITENASGRPLDWTRLHVCPVLVSMANGVSSHHLA